MLFKHGQIASSLPEKVRDSTQKLRSLYGQNIARIPEKAVDGTRLNSLWIWISTYVIKGANSGTDELPFRQYASN